MRVVPLTGSHDRQSFDCGRQELNDWLRQVARQHQDKGLSKTFVAIREEEGVAPTLTGFAAPQGGTASSGRPSESLRIYGYYALTLAELDSRHLPEAWRKKLPRRVPGVRLGRLAVDQRFQGKKLGELLMVDALTRAQRIYAEAGGIGLFIDAIDEPAAGYYLRFGFRVVPDNPLLLFFPVGVAAR